MKNLRIIYVFSLLLAFAFSGCEKEYEDLYTVTNYADFKMEGDEIIFNPFGSPFTDPGVKASEAGADLPVTTTVSGDYFGGTSFDPNVADRYVYTYSATNSDGYPGSTTRYVYNIQAGDLVSSIEGLYTSTVVRNGVVAPAYTDMEYVMIAKTGENTYGLSDAIGGYYDIGRGFGAAYRAQGMIITATDIPGNQFTFGTAEVGTFGGVVTMESLTVDPVAKTIVLTNSWDAGYTFEITLTQVEL